MSLRQQAKILGTSHANLSRMINGVRPWNAKLKERYDELVGTTFGTTHANTLRGNARILPKNPQNGHDIAEVIGSNPLPPTITLCVRQKSGTKFLPAFPPKQGSKQKLY